MEEAEDWLRRAREALALDGYEITLKPGWVAVTTGKGDFGGDVMDSVVITEAIKIERLPVVRIVAVTPAASPARLAVDTPPFP